MKKILTCIIILLTFLCSNTSYGLNSSIKTTDLQLKTILSKYTNQKILYFKSFDINKNQNAAFALVGSGEIWYIKSPSAQKLRTIDLPDGNPITLPEIWSVGNTKIFKCESSGGGSSSTSYAWYIKNGNPVLLNNTAGGLSYLGDGKFTTVGEAFDNCFTDGMGTGHTYKPYYLFWVNNGFKEYGGIKITKQQLLKVNGAKSVIDAIEKSGNKIDIIYYRANHIININYHNGDKNNGNFENVSLEYKNNAVKPILAYSNTNNSKIDKLTSSNLEEFSYGGIYKAALFTQIATYPQKFQ